MSTGKKATAKRCLRWSGMKKETPTNRKRTKNCKNSSSFGFDKHLHLQTQMHIVKCFAFAKRETICYRILWNISPCSMWNEICPRPRKRTFHICGANISPRSDFTCPKGQISLGYLLYRRYPNGVLFLGRSGNLFAVQVGSQGLYPCFTLRMF